MNLLNIIYTIIYTILHVCLLSDMLCILMLKCASIQLITSTVYKYIQKKYGILHLP